MVKKFMYKKYNFLEPISSIFIYSNKNTLTPYLDKRLDICRNENE